MAIVRMHDIVRFNLTMHACRPNECSNQCIFHAVPDAPEVQILPRYQDGQIQILIGLLTAFPTVV